MKPRRRTDKSARAQARNIRDYHWEIMEKIAENGALRVCLWDKKRLEQQPDEVRMGLISGMEWMNWVNRHRGWFQISRAYDDARDTRLMKLTEAGRRALRNRVRYDMEPVEGGLVEPGWVAVPARRKEATKT
jgi:hypothetical protein